MNPAPWALPKAGMERAFDPPDSWADDPGWDGIGPLAHRNSFFGLRSRAPQFCGVGRIGPSPLHLQVSYPAYKEEKSYEASD